MVKNKRYGYLLDISILGILGLIAACDGVEPQPEVAPAEREIRGDNGLGYNGLGYNGLGYNGLGYNGLGYNGLGYNGLGYNGLGYNGLGSNGLGYNGLGYNGLGYNGLIWDGKNWNGITGQNAPTFTTLHNWVNHTDTDGAGAIPVDCNTTGVCGTPTQCQNSSYMNDVNDVNARILALRYFISCACPDNVSIDFNDTHGRVPATTFYGQFGLAPTWCGTGAGPSSVDSPEVQAVSACLLARVNNSGTHVPLSLRGAAPGLALSTNEQWMYGTTFSAFAGNLWKPEHWDQDRYTGERWWNQEKFTFNWAPWDLAYNPWVALGRTCDTTDCNRRMENLGYRDAGAKKLDTYGYAVDPRIADQNHAVPGGVATDTSSAYSAQVGDYTNVVYRDRKYFQVFVALPCFISFGQSTRLNSCYGGTQPKGWNQWLVGSPSTIVSCPSCIWPTYLQGITSSQTEEIVLSGAPYTSITPNADEAVTVAIRYSTGSTLSKNLNVWVNNTAPPNAIWRQVHGNGSIWGKQIFNATGTDATNMQLAYFYPVYLHNTAGLDSSGYSNTGKNDTLRLKISGTSGTATDAPNLDTAYFFPGPPPEGSNWSWVEPIAQTNSYNYLPVSVTQNQIYTYPTKTLPPGNYTFWLFQSGGASNLSVTATPASTAGPSSACSASATAVGTWTFCTATMPHKGGTFAVNVTGVGASNTGNLTVTY